MSYAFLPTDRRMSSMIWGRNPRRTMIRAIAWGLATVVVVRFIAQPVWIRGTSMEPTFRDGTLHVVNLLAFRLRPPRTGEVVAIRMVGSRTFYLKRIIAGPGETVSFRDGLLVVNGKVHEEPYVATPYTWSTPAVVLGANEYFVAGDNREGPVEAHAAGVVRKEHIAGNLWF